jgi:hypothetical protein
MTAILGLRCDTCGKMDIEDREDEFSEDSFPRNGWYSLNRWAEGGGLEGPEKHYCSLKCIEKFARTEEPS